MNRQEVLTALREAIHPKNELYKKASHEYRTLDQVWADQARAHDLAPPVADVLRRQPEYLQCPTMAIRHDFGVTPFDPIPPLSGLLFGR
jgi:hypothetical protein